MKKKSTPIDPVTKALFIAGGGTLILGGLMYLFSSPAAASTSAPAVPVGGPLAPAPSTVTTTFTPGHRYFATLYSPGPVSAPTAAATQTSFDAQYGAGATTIVDVEQAGANVIVITFDVVSAIPPLTASPSVENVIDLGPTPAPGGPAINFLVPAPASTTSPPEVTRFIPIVATPGTSSLTMKVGEAVVWTAAWSTTPETSNTAILREGSSYVGASIFEADSQGTAYLAGEYTDYSTGAAVSVTTQLNVTVVAGTP